MTRQKDDKSHVNKGLLILSTFDESSPMQRTTDIASKLGMNMSTVSRHLNSLLDLGFLSRDDATGQYYLGLEVISLAGAALHNSVLYRYAYPELQKMSFQHEVHCHMSVQRDADIVHIISTSCEKNMELLIPMGHRHPVYCSAIRLVESDDPVSAITTSSTNPAILSRHLARTASSSRTIIQRLIVAIIFS